MDWIPGWVPSAAAGAVSGGIAWLLSWRISAARAEGKDEANERNSVTLRAVETKASEEASARIQTALKDLRDDWREGMDEIRAMSQAHTELQASQNVTNAVTQKTLEAFAAKLDSHASMIADHASTLRLLTDKVMANSNRLQ